MKQLIVFFMLLSILVPSLVPSVLAQVEYDDGEIELFGTGAEEVLSFLTTILAVVLATLTWIAYKRSKRKKLVYVASAFTLFAIHGLLNSYELFFPEVEFLEPIGPIVLFLIMVIFFIGVVKK